MKIASAPLRRHPLYRRILFLSLTLFSIIMLIINLKEGMFEISWHQLRDILFFSEGEEKARQIVIELRWPAAVTAFLSGAALAIGGLLMQTLFRNPLADPSILGISAGSGLGVGVLTLTAGHLFGFSVFSAGFTGQLALIAAAFLGAVAVLFFVMLYAFRTNSSTRLLILGVMIGYVSYSAISLMKYFSLSDDLKFFVVWGMGSFSEVGSKSLPLFSGALLIGLLSSFLIIKPLNMIWLGESMAQNLGLPLKRARLTIIFVAGYLTAVVTAFCGPIAFIGLAVPHMSRTLLATADHSRLLPLNILVGANLALVVNSVSRMAIFGGALPVNVITAMIGAPVVVVMLWKWKDL